MCRFCSAVTKGDGKLILFDWEIRRELIKNNPESYEHDSHTSICHYFKLDEDETNKYEYNPLLKKFRVDQINIRDDRALSKKNFDELDWKKIIEPLIIKEIINPLTDSRKHKVTKKDIRNLKKWDSVRYSVRYSVWDSVRDSVWDSVRDSVRYSVRDSVRYSVRDSVWDSVGDSVGDSVRYSVRDSVGGYLSSFFNIKYKYDFSPTVRLWERGFVPSFDGKIWRLHQGRKAEVVYEWER